MLEDIVVILFACLIITSVGTGMTNRSGVNPLINDIIIGCSLLGLSTAIISIIGSIIQWIGLISADTLRSMVTYLATHCPLIAVSVSGLILADNNYQLRAICADRLSQLIKIVKSSKLNRTVVWDIVGSTSSNNTGSNHYNDVQPSRSMGIPANNSMNILDSMPSIRKKAQ